MPKELKKWELSQSPRPIHSGRYKLVSNTVTVTTAQGTPGYAYVAFSDAFVEDIGRLLGGVMESNPAIVYVNLFADTFSVYAHRVNDAGMRMLFNGEGHPAWIKFHKQQVKKNGHKTSGHSDQASSNTGPGQRRLSARDPAPYNGSSS